MGAVVDRAAVLAWRQGERQAGRRVVFTNGVFDLLHRGHVEYLAEARALGAALVVGVNDDASVRRLKGPGRPLITAADRAQVLAALAVVDRVVLFAEDTPRELIAALLPDVLVKGGDYALEGIVGRAEVEAAGGEVRRIAFRPGYSTSDLLARLRALDHPAGA
ncbi:MAG TPA: D-glycero-beta-D-manno-heptose 1-phosphate adenylyltransferase [Candidatus Udaeobacter sp.]|nr:D-glycero-beta-D-manno-heptose 1-phosphate adenylyltransferase [Candidatus Udaeobacter sp.]